MYIINLSLVNIYKNVNSYKLFNKIYNKFSILYKFNICCSVIVMIDDVISDLIKIY